MLRKYPFLYGMEVCFEAFPQNAGIGLFALQGGFYIKKDILGNFKAKQPFGISYRSIPKTDFQRITKTEWLTKMSDWLAGETIEDDEGNQYKLSYPLLEGNRKVEMIEPTSNPYLQGIDENGTEDYRVTFSMIYRKEI